MYAHGGSENHGCEAIIRSTEKILKDSKKPLLLSYDKNQDIKYGVDEVVNINQGINAINRKSFDFIKAYFYQKILNNYHYMDSLMHKEAIVSLPKMDISLFVGGDNYCYSNTENYSIINQYIRKKSNKMLLWGTSIEPELLKDKIIRKDIQRYDMIFARESISYNALKEVNPNTYLYPDPAFQLDKIELPLPNYFIEGNTVGINVSPLIMSCETNKGITRENYIKLVEYIINETDMNVALIPHVVCENNDDRKPLQELYDMFKHTNRVCLIEDHNCMELKGYISRCRFFVGARTHATIAAYSTCVPTLVVGYSVKAKGIAKDIFGTYDNYVLPVQTLREENDLELAFKWLLENEMTIKFHLNKMMPEYSLKSLKAGEVIRGMK